MNTVHQQQLPSPPPPRKRNERGKKTPTNERKKSEAGKRQYEGNRAHIHQEAKKIIAGMTPEPHEPVNNFSNCSKFDANCQQYIRTVYRRIRQAVTLLMVVANDDISQKREN